MDWRSLTNSKLALAVGIGGGGDALGTIPTRNSLKRSNFDVMIGSVVWERIVIDPKPGPRSIEELENLEGIICETVCIASGRTKVVNGVVPQICRIADALNERVLILDITKGPKKLADGIKKACEHLSTDIIIGIDVGGDVLATGKEKGLSSPLCDSICLAALANSGVKSIIGIYGIGCDGELKLHELERRLSEVASKGCLLGAIGMTKDDIALMEMLLGRVHTEASRLAALSAKGLMGEVPIRSGERTAQVSIFSSITFFLDAKALFELSTLARAVADAGSLEEANEALHSLGIKTELDFEREYVRT